MRVALVHDALVNKGGAERVFQAICELYPSAPIYTSVYLPDATLPYFRSRDVITTPLQWIVRSEAQLKRLFPLALHYMSKMRLAPCEIVISSSTFCAKYAHRDGAAHVCLCYRPFRLIWSAEQYQYARLAPPVRLGLAVTRPFLKWLDCRSAQRIDAFVTTTNEMRDLIKDVYRKIAVVIPPPVSLTGAALEVSAGDYYLVVARLEAYKRVDLAIRAFNHLGLPLVVVGAGSQERRLRMLAGEKVTFFGIVDEGCLTRLYRECRAVICPQEEDFGLVSLEANSHGRPAVCYGVGGARTTMVPHTGMNPDDATAVFFYEQSPGALAEAVRMLGYLEFRGEVLRRNAARFHPDRFRAAFRSVIQSVLNGSEQSQTGETIATHGRRARPHSRTGVGRDRYEADA